MMKTHNKYLFLKIISSVINALNTMLLYLSYRLNIIQEKIQIKIWLITIRW